MSFRTALMMAYGGVAVMLVGGVLFREAKVLGVFIIAVGAIISSTGQFGFRCPHCERFVFLGGGFSLRYCPPCGKPLDS